MKARVKSFYLAVMGDGQSQSLVSFVNESYHACEGRKLEKRSGETCQRILLFNSMSVRDLHLIFTHRRNTCAKYGVDFKKALLFVPNMSMSRTVGMNALLENNDEASVDLSWQYTLQEVWECLVGKGDGGKNGENSEVFSSLPLAIKLRDIVVDHNSSLTRLQVLVTGSLQLMGDVLRLVTK